MTLGEIRVRLGFNPDKNLLITKVKEDTAKLIDLCDKEKALDPRLAALAQTAFEEAAMWAVKLLSTKKCP